MKNDISKIFNLQAFHVYEVRVIQSCIEIQIKLKKKYCKCPHCGQRFKRLHQLGKERRIKHQLWGKTTVYLVGRKNRWECSKCKKPFTEVWPGLKKWSRKTEAAEYQIINLLKGKSFRQLSAEDGVSDHEARYLLAKVDPTPTWQEEQKRRDIKLGIDEHSFRGRNLVITVTNLSQHRLKAILPDDQQRSIKEWLRAIPDEIKPKIKEVCIDMKELFAAAIREELPQTDIVLDHFHVISDANQRLDEARCLEQEMQRRRHIGKRWWFLMGRERLDKKHRGLLDQLLEHYDSLKEFYYYKEQLRTLYRSKNREVAAVLLSRIILNMECSDDAAINQWGRTLKRWRLYLLNYFNHRTTNAFTEGAHNKIKMIKRMSFGFRNVQTYIRKMMIAFIPIAYLGGLIWHTLC